jgi:hypothetical protein
MRRLALLHALAWPDDEGVKIGTVRVEYQDGSQSEIPVRSKIDAGEWSGACQTPNGRPARLSKDFRKDLYMSLFPVEPKPVSKISFISEGKSVWIIAAATAAGEPLPEPVETPFVIAPSKEWAVIDYSQDVEPGSALDLSQLLDAPAGKHGRVIRGGEDWIFENAPDKKLRLYGVNICFWSGKPWSRGACDKLAERLAAAGFNSARLHAYDACFLVKDAPGYVIDKAVMESFDYLFSALKKRGIYLTTDLYVMRPFRKGEVKELSRARGGLQEFPAIIPVSDTALENWKNFAGELLTHKNPFTGLAWKDDPALVSLSMVNENDIFSLKSSVIDKTPDIKAIYDAKFEAWLLAGALTPGSAKERESLRIRFLLETFGTAYFKMRDFLRSLGVSQPLTDQNLGAAVPLSLARALCDYTDNHFYFDFPKFAGKVWAPPMGLDNVSAVSRMNTAQAGCFATRLFGKPFMITEFNWLYPNAFRAEMGAIAPAYAALQDWSGLYLYQYSAGDEKVFLSDGPASRWELTVDPVCALSMRIGSLLYLRGDVKASDITLPVAVDDACLLPAGSLYYPKILKDLGLVAKVGTVVASGSAVTPPAGAKILMTLRNNRAIPDRDINMIPVGDGNEKAALDAILKTVSLGAGALESDFLRAASSTGELEIDAKANSFKAVTPNSEAITAGGGGVLKGSVVSVDNKSGPATFLAASLDGKTLRSSSRILILHLTDTVNSGLTFRSKEMKVVERMGSLPHLARRARAEMRLALGGEPGSWTLYGLTFAGRRAEEKNLSPDAKGELRVEMDGFSVKEPRFAYELVRIK